MRADTSLYRGYFAGRGIVSNSYGCAGHLPVVTARARRDDVEEVAMAALFSGDDRRRYYSEDDYRAYLISRNPPPIIHHSAHVYWKRLRVRARRVASRTDSVLNWMIEALARSKTGRIRRELQLRSIRSPQRVDEAPSKRLPK